MEKIRKCAATPLPPSLSTHLVKRPVNNIEKNLEKKLTKLQNVLPNMPKVKYVPVKFQKVALFKRPSRLNQSSYPKNAGIFHWDFALNPPISTKLAQLDQISHEKVEATFTTPPERVKTRIFPNVAIQAINRNPT